MNPENENNIISFPETNNEKELSLEEINEGINSREIEQKIIQREIESRVTREEQLKQEIADLKRKLKKKDGASEING